MTIFPPPLNPAAVSEPDVYKAVKAFISQYGLPAMPPATPKIPSRIYQGWVNRAALPPDNEYAVMSIISHLRRGTNVETFDASQAAIDEDGVLTTAEMIECDVQIDFYSDPHRPGNLASQFFAQYGIACQYATDARDLSFVGDAEQYVSRWMTTIRLSFVTAVSAELPWFDAVTLKRLENVDVHHKP